MNSPVVLSAPAKINLFLRITGRRDDGYHLLQTVFQFLDLEDEVRLWPRSDGQVVRVNDVEGVPPDEDLAIRAARLLQAACGTSLGANIEVVKRIPMGGGLGGGSSDAATVLVGLNAVWKAGLGTDELATLGLTLGADVPVFVHGHATWAEGVGEEFTAIAIEQCHYLLAFPGVHVPTGVIFSSKDLTRDCEPLTIGGFPSHEGYRRARELMQAGNVCEAVVRRAHPDVDACLGWLESFAPARMTGTGSACFALVDNGTAIPAGRWESRRVRGLNVSPLAQQVEAYLHSGNN